MVRGSLTLTLLLFKFDSDIFKNVVTGGWVTGAILFVTAIVAAISLKESYGKKLDFIGLTLILRCYYTIPIIKHFLN